VLKFPTQAKHYCYSIYLIITFNRIYKSINIKNKEVIDDRFVGGKEASKILGVHQRTLYNWDSNKLIEVIRTPGNKRLYNVSKYLREKKEVLCNVIDPNDLDKMNGKFKIVYVRVSSLGQRNDLFHQKSILVEAYPEYLVIEDIGSGMNLNRRGLRKIISLAIAGKIDEVVIAYKDRLTRFGYELIEDLIKEYSNGKITILNHKDDMEPEEELMSDMLEIMNVFVAKRNGLRKYRNYKRK